MPSVDDCRCAYGVHISNVLVNVYSVHTPGTPLEHECFSAGLFEAAAEELLNEIGPRRPQPKAISEYI